MSRRNFADLHTHTPLCGHAAGTAEEYARQAVKAGLSWFGAGDHYPLPEGYPLTDSMRPHEYPLYRNNWMEELRRTLKNTGITVLYGTEYDFLAGEDARREIMNQEPFDYRISSIHFLEDFAIDNPDNLPCWQRLGGADAVWKMYAETMLKMVDGGGFEIIGHIDLPKKFSVYPSDRKYYANAMRDVLHLAAEKGICMELNTAGLRKPVGEIYPAPEIVRIAKEAGVGITFGSDAHAPGEVGQDFELAQELAESAGYRSAFTFRNKEKIELPFS